MLWPVLRQILIHDLFYSDIQTSFDVIIFLILHKIVIEYIEASDSNQKSSSFCRIFRTINPKVDESGTY